MTAAPGESRSSLSPHRRPRTDRPPSMFQIMSPSRTFSLVIDRPWAEAYGFLSDPRTIGQWTQGVIDAPLDALSAYQWRTSYGGHSVTIEFTPPNDFGILDLTLRWADGSARHFFIRVFPNGPGSELCCTVLQRTGETDEEFASECEWLRTDLSILKAHLEGR